MDSQKFDKDGQPISKLTDAERKKQAAQVQAYAKSKGVDPNIAMTAVDKAMSKNLDPHEKAKDEPETFWDSWYRWSLYDDLAHIAVSVIDGLASAAKAAGSVKPGGGDFGGGGATGDWALPDIVSDPVLPDVPDVDMSGIGDLFSGFDISSSKYAEPQANGKLKLVSSKK